jgi:MYXO-CTERM domain-containing protein
MGRTSLFALALVAVSSTASADEPTGFPITDPSHTPYAKGLGQAPGAKGSFNSPTLLFVNFDGGTMNGGCGDDSHNNCSTIIQGEIMPYPGDESDRAAVIQAVREDTTDFGIITIDQRPPDNMPYAMVMVGEPNFDVGQVGGVAPGIDCGNNDPNDTSFAFLVTAGPNTIATVINQEAAHTWGLEHVDDDLDNLFPTAGGTANPTYRDVCSQIVSNTDLNPSGGVCNEVHTMFCQSGHQNSYQELLLVFGPPVPDNVAPTVSIDEPADGSAFAYEDDWDLVITLQDDRTPQILVTSIFFDDVEVVTDQQFLNTTLDFPINGGDPPMGHGLSEGDHTIRVEITDEGGNPSSAEVTISIMGGPPPGADTSGDGTGGSGSADSSGGDDGGGTAGDSSASATGPDQTGSETVTCSCDVDRSPAPGLALLALLSLLARRRRQR